MFRLGLVGVLVTAASIAAAQTSNEQQPGGAGQPSAAGEPATGQGGGHQPPGAAGGQAAGGQAAAGGQDKEALIQDALSAAPPMIVETVAVMDWDGTMLREGDKTFVCMPTHPDKRAAGGKEPMCLDAEWMTLGDAWMNKKDYTPEKVGIAYMLAGDAGASNVDPYATEKTADNQWIAEGPHLMIVLPDKAALDAFPTDPQAGGPYVMWKDTPYAHIMVPVGERPAQ